MNKLIIAAVVAIVVIAGVVLFVGGQSQKQDTTPTPTPTEVMEKEDEEEAMEEEDEDEEATDGAAQKGSALEGAMMEKSSVEIKNFAFGPKTLTIEKGTSVTFTNQDSVAHTATADGGSFDTGLLAKGESRSITFDKAGTFNYHCTPHPNMKATIVVE